MALIKKKTEAELAIGNLLIRSETNQIVKRVISAFDHTAKTTANYKSLSVFKLDMLEPCAEFLNLELADPSGNKLYTKDSLVHRILFELRALLPSECSECNSTYVIDFEAEQKPLFHCHMCYRGSHSCPTIVGLHESLSQASVDLLSGHVWLCKACKESSTPIKYRKSKSRHESVSLDKPDLPPSHVRDAMDSQQSSPIQSVVQTPGGKPIEEADLRRELKTVLKERICQKYKRGVCPHGLKGKKKVDGQVCEFEHPK